MISRLLKRYRAWRWRRKIHVVYPSPDAPLAAILSDEKALDDPKFEWWKHCDPNPEIEKPLDSHESFIVQPLIGIVRQTSDGNWEVELRNAFDVGRRALVMQFEQNLDCALQYAEGLRSLGDIEYRIDGVEEGHSGENQELPR